MFREQGGVYSCHVSNEHGEEVANVTIDVLYKPECKILKKQGENSIELYCRLDQPQTGG